MLWLFQGEKSLRICLAVLTEHWRVTDRRTDILRRHSPRYEYCAVKTYTERNVTHEETANTPNAHHEIV